MPTKKDGDIIIPIITMNDLRNRYDEDYFNSFPGDWLLKPQEDHYWQLMCSNSLGLNGRFFLRLIMSECYDMKIRAQLYVEKRDRTGKVIDSKTITIPDSAVDNDLLVEKVATLGLDIQDALKGMRFKGTWITSDISSFLRRLIRFRHVIEDDGFKELIIFNEDMPPMPPDLYEEDEESLYQPPEDDN